MAGIMTWITFGLSALGAIIALALLIVYIKSYTKVKAKFTLSLILVAFFFLAQNSLMVYSIWTMMADFSDLVYNFMMVTIGFGDIALGLLLYNSWK
ncbi:MAG: hypothetical protein ACMUIE_10290 [Thermoplasmatota archaeon]